MTARRIILGADAGGTKTVAWLASSAHGEFEVLGRGAAGPGNPLRVGRDTALANVAASINAARDAAGSQAGDISQAVIGMAGAGRPEIRQSMSARLREESGIQHIKVVPDFALVLPAAFANRVGIAVICGTGSIVHGVRDNQQTRVGGWGYLIDDHGSGYWFGRAALRAMARAADGRGSRTAISDLVSAKFDNKDVPDIIASLHDSPNRLTQIAALAPVVFDAATAGDEVARQIVDQAAAALAEMIATAARQLGYTQPEIPLAGAGGVLVGARLLQDQLSVALQCHSLRPVPFQLVREPVSGAMRLAENQLAS